jgi:hypothetical protein
MDSTTKKIAGHVLDQKARGITDPVERLRYLQQSFATIDRAEQKSLRIFGWLVCFWPRKFWLFAIGAATAVFASLFWWPKETPTPAREVLVVREVPALPPAVANASAAAKHEEIWLVESKGGVESWSNGLRVETAFATSTRPRQPYVFDRQLRKLPDSWPAEQPAGIVFHTTESHLEDLQPDRNSSLKKISQSLIHYVREERGYHYVIDRFGRVYRVVKESDKANHSGHSLWADDKHTWVNLNENFLAVAFETQTRAGDENAIVTSAQIASGRLLTAALRSRYHINASNCVTHAQVSMNPRNGLIGWHTDWAGNFPFEDIGLPNNYRLPLPSIAVAGFGYDPVFFASTGARMWDGVMGAEGQLRQEAKTVGRSVAALKSERQQRTRALLAEYRSLHHKESGASSDNSLEQEPGKEEVKE